MPLAKITICMSILIVNSKIVNEGKVEERDVLVEGDTIVEIAGDLSHRTADVVIDGEGQFLMPGVIDDQVHFREPGLTHKATIYTESRAAVAGGITTYMEMPNTVPNALTQELLQDKYDIAAKDSLANYSFYMGASNENIEEVLRTDPDHVCGVKVFMGSSTGNMLVDNETTLSEIFSKCPMLIATHCEDEATIQANLQKAHDQFGDDIPITYHPIIRSEEACYRSSSLAVELAKQYQSRLHVLHISTARELSLFNNSENLETKKITSEACIHHLWFEDSSYPEKGTFIKWNPAVKTANDRAAIFGAVLDGTIDVIATDHAPHTREEKANKYDNAPSGGPLAQHSLVAMMDFYHDGKITVEKIVEKMCHNPAVLFRVEKRGFIREGYKADLVVVNPHASWTVDDSNILAKCGWSPFSGHTFKSAVTHTIVSGHLAYANGVFNEASRGQRLTFTR